jgi:hypothetical protein
MTKKNDASENNKAINYEPLLAIGLEFKKTRLGQAVFIPREDSDAHNGLFPDRWTIAQLRAMASFMEQNPNCTIYDDGSGKPCR